MATQSDAANLLASQYNVVLPDPKTFSDLGNAERLVDLHRGNIRFCAEWDKWLVWDTKRWAPNIDGAIIRIAVDTIRSMYLHASKLTEAASQADEPEIREKYTAAAAALTAWGRKSESRGKIEAMAKLAEAMPGIPVAPAALDNNPWHINCENGTFNLNSMALEPHNPDDMITRLAPVAYDPDAGFELWNKFLDRILPDPDVQAFVQRALGYSITGVTTEEKLFFPYGPTGTGKSTLLRAVAAAIGDYATTADFGTFLAQDRTGRPNEDLARLNGRRFVVSVEVDQGQKMAESLIKQVSGGDVMTARFLYGQSFTFLPVFKLWLAANNRPRVRDDDDAIWRRIVQIAFDQQIPEDEQDGDVKSALADPAVAGPAVLLWLIEGCRMWKRDGLHPPESVRTTTTEYREEMNPLTEFLEESCVIHPLARSENPAMWQEYLDWAKRNMNGRALGRKNFTQRLELVANVQLHRNGQGRFWEGIGLLRHVSPSQQSMGEIDGHA